MTIRAAIDVNGVVRKVDADGHAGTDTRGGNIACAAVSVLLRTAFETLGSYEGVKAKGVASEPGSLSFKLEGYPETAMDMLKGVTDFLLTGLSGVEREFPGAVDLTVEIDRRK